MKKNSDRLFNIINYSFLTLLTAVIFYPIWFTLIASISDPTYVNLGQVWLFPKGFTFEGYKRIMDFPAILTGYKNTIIYTAVGTCVNLVVLLPASFALSRKELPFRKFFMMFFIITMYFTGGIVPLYLQVRNLDLLDSMWALILPGAFNVYNMIICRNFFINNIPEEIFESAKVDGASYTGFFVKIVLPLSTAIVAVMTLFHALLHWNNYTSALYYLRNDEKFPLQLVLRNFADKLQQESLMNGSNASVAAEAQRQQEAVKYSVVVFTSLPVLLLYPFVQKYFVKGIMVGAVKG